MFFLYGKRVIDLDSMISAELYDVPGPGMSYLQITMQGGGQICIGGDEDPEEALNALVDALDQHGLLCRPEEPVHIELDEDELGELSAALSKGYEWIARDKNGKIFGYKAKPEEGKASWDPTFDDDPCRFPADWFSEITFKSGPMNIKALLLGA